MKKLKKIVFLFTITVIFVTGCSNNKIDSPEKLIATYLEAVHNEDFEKILNLLPKEIRKYVLENNIVSSEDEAIEKIELSLNDYYWLVEADLPDRKTYSFEIIEEEEDEVDSVNTFFEKEELEIKAEAAESIRVEINLNDNEKVKAGFWMIKVDGSWYFTSIVGDDDLFFY